MGESTELQSFYLALGRFVYQFSVAEDALRLLYLKDAYYREGKVSEKLDKTPLSALIRELIEERGNDYSGRVLPHFLTIIELRNEVLHKPVKMHKNGDFISGLSSVSGADSVDIPCSPDDLLAATVDIQIILAYLASQFHAVTAGSRLRSPEMDRMMSLAAAFTDLPWQYNR